MLARDNKSFMPEFYGEKQLFKQPFNLLKLYNMSKSKSLQFTFIFYIYFFLHRISVSVSVSQLLSTVKLDSCQIQKKKLCGRYFHIKYLIYCSVRDQIWSMDTVYILYMRKWPS